MNELSDEEKFRIKIIYPLVMIAFGGLAIGSMWKEENVVGIVAGCLLLIGGVTGTYHYLDKYKELIKRLRG